MPDLLSEEEPEPSRLERFGDWLERTIGPREEMPDVPGDEPEPSDLAAWLFAYLPDVAPLYDRNGRALLPAGLIPLTRVTVAETARPEARQTIRAFSDAGIAVKILASEDPTRAAGTAGALGLEIEPAAVVTGGTLAAMDSKASAETVRDATVFADLTSTQKANILTSLRKQGEYVAMVGDSPSDVPAMRQANLKVALRSGSQAALTETDIVLLKDSLEALPRVLITAQRLVSGILDTFKLYLSQLSMQLLLILVVALLQLRHYPYNPTQAGVISAFTIAFPVILLAIWSYPSIVSEESIRRQLLRFVIPVAVTLGILAAVVFGWFMTRTENPDYAQLGVTYALLAAGWLRLLFVQPPTPFWVGGAELRGDRRVIWLVIGMVLFFLFIMSFPQLREWLFFDLLDSVPDYLVVALAVGLWAVGLRAIWRARLMEPVVNRFSQRLRAS
jgi:cation-transporting ATPase E